MNEVNFNGDVGQFRKSDFMDSAEDMAGITQENPAMMTLDRMAVYSGVINKDGKKEDGVLAGIIVGQPRKLRMNAAKRKIMIAAAGTANAKNWNGMRLAVYTTCDSDRQTGGKESTSAVGIDCMAMVDDAKGRFKKGEWLNYWFFQQPAGKKHALAAIPDRPQGITVQHAAPKITPQDVVDFVMRLTGCDKQTAAAKIKTAIPEGKTFATLTDSEKASLLKPETYQESKTDGTQQSPPDGQPDTRPGTSLPAE